MIQISSKEELLTSPSKRGKDLDLSVLTNEVYLNIIQFYVHMYV